MKPRWHRITVAALAAAVPGAALAEEWLGPVNTTGAVTYSMQQTKQASGVSSLQHTGTLTVNPSTYIYEPWLLQSNASINLSKAVASGDNVSSSNMVTGNVVVNVLPQSDYPVEFNYSRYSRNVQLGEDLNELTGQSMKLRSIVNMADDWSISSHIQADDSVDSKGLGETSSEVGVEVDKRFAEDQMRLGALHRQSAYTGSTELGDATAASDTMTFRHRSHPFETVTTDSTSTLRLATYTEKNYSEESSVMQGVTTAIWRPQEVKDLAVHGAMRTFRQNATMTRATDMRVRDAQTAFGTLATSYVLRPRLVGNVGINAGYSDTTDTSTGSNAPSITGTGQEATSAITYGGGTGLDYTSLASDIEGFNWNWNTGGSVDAANSGSLGLTHSESVRAGHSISRQLDLFVVDQVNFAASEGTGLVVSSRGFSMPVSHSMTLSKQNRDGKTWNFWHASGSDSRSLGGVTSLYQLVNLQLTQGYDPDRFSSWSASLSFQAARQILAEIDTGFVDTVGGQMTYRERHILGLDNLNFTSDLAINPPSVIARNREQDFANTTRNTSATTKTSMLGTQRWTNRLDYIIGQLRMSLTARINRDDSGINETMLFQMSRRF